MGAYNKSEKECCEQSNTDDSLREKIAELEVKLHEANKKIINLDRLRECQDRIIKVYELMHSKEGVQIDTSTEKYITRQKRIFDNKVNHGFNTTNIYQEARYILEEVAELMRAIEKNDRENMREELADIVIFAYGCAEVARLGDLDTEIFKKMQINEGREYHKTDEGDFVKDNK